MADLSLAGLALSILITATPLMLAATGELVVERAGVLNLGVEGMMLTGAVTGFLVALWLSQGPLPGPAASLIGFAAAAGAGMVLALLHGVLTVIGGTSQVASGLALVLFGQGLASTLGKAHVGTALPEVARLGPWGPVAVAVILPLLVALVLARSRMGLVLRAVGDDHDSAHALGHPVRGVRIAALAFGGALAGLGGAFLSLIHVPSWLEGLTDGRGWIAVALVVFAGWRPLWVLGGAVLFGGLSVLELHGQASGLLPVPSQLLTALPYLVTVAVLALVSAGRLGRLRAPAMLGRPFLPSR